MFKMTIFRAGIDLSRGDICTVKEFAWWIANQKRLISLKAISICGLRLLG
jgi:hypothetical protein